MRLLLKRVYAPAAPEDGFRVLVDRLWPRGVSKERAAVDLWAKDVAPSAELRTAFHRGGMDAETFAQAYAGELQANPALPVLRDLLAAHDVVTLLYSVADEERNHAVLLRAALDA